MKKLLLLCVAVTLIYSLSFATIRRVGFFGTAISGVDYATFALAHTAASPGDTIMMMPGTRFENDNMTKRLVVIGPGYFLSQNTGLQATTLGMDTTSSALQISNIAANGSVFISCAFTNPPSSGTSGVTITAVGAANISFIRCRFSGGAGGGYSSSSSNNNILFQQCVFMGLGASLGSASINIGFMNCLFYNTTNVICIQSSSASNSGLIQNCIFQVLNASYSLLGTWDINNSISQGYSFAGSGITYKNNIGTGTQFPIGNGNQQNRPWNTIFTLTGSTDAQFALKAGSPAIGAGIGGIDAGIFGGPTPYRLSGIPPIPTIYFLNSSQGPTPTGNIIQINVSTRSNN